MREWLLVVGFCALAFGFPFACGAIFDYADAHSATVPVGGSIGSYIAR